MGGRQNTGARRRERVTFRFLAPEHLERAQAAAARAGQTLNDFARGLLVAATAGDGGAEDSTQRPEHEPPVERGARGAEA